MYWINNVSFHSFDREAKKNYILSQCCLLIVADIVKFFPLKALVSA